MVFEIIEVITGDSDWSLFTVVEDEALIKVRVKGRG